MSEWVRAGLRHAMGAVQDLFQIIWFGIPNRYLEIKCALGAKKRSWVGDINGKVISTEIVINTLEAGKIIKGEKI